MRRSLFILAFGLAGLDASLAWAATPVEKASAEALFDEGRALLAQGKYKEACPKLEASQKLDPGVGTMLNLADCYEKSGKTASAWALFREAASAAQSAGSGDRAEVARSRAEALSSRLSYVTIAGSQGESLVVTLDGTKLDAAALGTAMPVDPGTHEVVATAPGKRKWSTIVEVAEGGARVSVAVPILTDDPAPGGSSTDSPAKAEPESAGEDPGSTQKVLALTVGAVGVAGIAVGTIFGLKASSDWNDAKSNCDPYPFCGPEGVRREDDARTSATVSTIGFAVGVAGLAGGVLLWLTAPKSDSEAGVSVGLAPNGVLVRGRM